MRHAANAVIILLAFSTLGLWGCSQQKNGNAFTRLKEIEARHAKLEDDYQRILSISDQHRNKIIQLENERVELNQEIERLQIVVKERDELKKSLTQRTGERDNLHQQITQFRQELQTLLGRVDAAMNTGTALSVTAANPQPTRSAQ